MTIKVRNLFDMSVTKTSTKIKSSPDLQPVTHQLENIEHIDIAKKMSYAKRLIRTNKNIIRSVKIKNLLTKDIIESISCTTQQRPKPRAA